MAKPVELSNGKMFKTKTAAKQHFKMMLARYSDEDVISDPDDHDDLCALLDRFDELISDGPSKIGPGIAHFERRLNRSDGWSSPGFWVVRVDGSETDFSYPKAVDGSAKSTSQDFYDACHNAVSRDLISLKQRQFDHFANGDGELSCDTSDEMITFAEAKLSHAEPAFGAIVDMFREHKGWKADIPPGTLTTSTDAQLSSHFLDPALAEEFRRFHHDLAVLRIVSKKAGLGRPSTPPKRPLHLRSTSPR